MTTLSEVFIQFILLPLYIYAVVLLAVWGVVRTAGYAWVMGTYKAGQRINQQRKEAYRRGPDAPTRPQHTEGRRY